MLIHLEAFKSADIYLIDQILKDRLHKGQRILDLGCGSGRNLIILETLGCEIYGVDQSAQAIDSCRRQLQSFKEEHFYVGDLLQHPFQTEHFDVVICNALFHFAKDQEDFFNWTQSAWNALKPAGLFFARLSTTIGLPNAKPFGFNYLASEQDLLTCEKKWKAQRIDPLKTTLVETTRTMTTWVLGKPV